MATIVEFRNAGYAIKDRALLESVSFKVESGETIVLLLGGMRGGDETAPDAGTPRRSSRLTRWLRTP